MYRVLRLETFNDAHTAMIQSERYYFDYMLIPMIDGFLSRTKSIVTNIVQQCIVTLYLRYIRGNTTGKKQ